MSNPSNAKSPHCSCEPGDIPASSRIAAQHGHLRDMIGQIQATLTNRPDRRDVIVHEIAALLKELEVHFHEEEDAGFFDQIDACAPQLTSETARLKEEHQVLLKQMRSLTALAETCEGSDPWWERLKTDFHQFSLTIMHHEAAENQLLQRAFNEDIGSHD
jgi:iron-sulfur cluster repair protein YtfE (RIC family)